MARYVRLYKSPAQAEGSVLGFSGSMTHAVDDPELHQWLGERGYAATPESDEQKSARLILGGFAVRTAAYHTAPGIPIPDYTVSVGHLLIEPPIRDEDLLPLGEFLSELPSINDDGLRLHYFVDNRASTPRPYTWTPDSLIGWWG